jgi:hypothetical protein
MWFGEWRVVWSWLYNQAVCKGGLTKHAFFAGLKGMISPRNKKLQASAVRILEQVGIPWFYKFSNIQTNFHNIIYNYLIFLTPSNF